MLKEVLAVGENSPIMEEYVETGPGWRSSNNLSGRLRALATVRRVLTTTTLPSPGGRGQQSKSFNEKFIISIR